MLALLLPSNEAKVNTTIDQRSCVNGNASAPEQVQANAALQYPSFMKQLLKSHLSGKFYLGLPKKFCDAHLPSHDETIVLVDEIEKEYYMKYSMQKNRLCGGWRCFSISHGLQEGDALVFHLIEPCKFKVYIMRGSKRTENDGTPGVQSFDIQASKPINTERQRHVNALAANGHQKKKAKLVSQTKSTMDTVHYSDRLPTVNTNVVGGITYSESILYFEDVRCFEDFKIQVNGLILDSEIPIHFRAKYYELCCSQKMFLHGHLIKGISTKLAVVMISETVSMADSIRAANLGTSFHQFECWDKTLKAFLDLGMVVGFLRHRLHMLAELLRECQVAVESKRKKGVQTEEEIRNLETAGLNAKSLAGCLDAEFEALKLKCEKLSFEFRELARAPW